MMSRNRGAEMAYKHCSKSYRNIDGVRYEQWTDDAEVMESEIARFKLEGIRYRVISGRLFKVVEGVEKVEERC